ncbi:MAG: hybrid sensor histidine kinase/response regulator [Bacteroidetes bacterium HGW-Bacteroidetes-11]|jgi:two-component system sensor histidine kinase/response regulator|nr:MAG: hybrid sensor histidine kinase/response regulator [Bacteroidetes bacterium HGW-Bacteroidetes-11]
MSNEKYIPNILIVDDVPANLKVLGGILKEDGYKIRPVLNGELALQVAAKERPDLIILDIMMPDMDGYEVCRRIKASPGLNDIPVIFISALSDTQDLVRAFISGGIDYITKPFQSEEVRARVSTHIRISRQSQELQRLNDEKDKFFSIIAHDLRGPIGAFKQSLELITGKTNLNENVKAKLLEQLKSSAKTTYNLLENLLNWAMSQADKVNIEPRNFILNQAIHENIELLLPLANQKQIDLTATVDDSQIVFADPDSIKLVIRNLLSNAIKFTPNHGAISISATGNGNMVEVTMQDTGVGMNKDIADKLFTSNEYYSSSGTNNEKGSGLGLVLVKDFVERNGGQIRVESAVNEGSKFIFTLPSRNS